MTTNFVRVLQVIPALSLLGCVSDFSPDPYNKLSEPMATPDAGPKDAGGKAATGSSNGGGSGTPDAQTGSSLPPDTTSDGGTPSGTNGGGTGSPSGPCDLTGRWITTEYSTSSALGALQLALGWLYAEIQQQGDKLVVTKSLFCGGSVNEAPGQIFTIHEDDSASWPAYQAKTNYTGRTGTSTASGSNCTVHFDDGVLIRGATVATYKDTSVAMPTKDQPASGSTPGWEDWDMDGNPGITMVVTKSATNSLYTSVRTHGTYDGSIAQNASDFKLTFDWTQDRTVLGSLSPDPAGILSTPASRADDDSVNFVEFARLASDQATGSDDDICNAMRTLAVTLNPAANAK